MATTYTKLRDGSWGIRSTTRVTEGGSVTVTKRDGTSKEERVGKVLFSKDGVWVAAIATAGRPAASSASGTTLVSRAELSTPRAPAKEGLQVGGSARIVRALAPGRGIRPMTIEIVRNSSNYNVASGPKVDFAREYLEKAIAKGGPDGARVIGHVQSTMPQDMMVRANALRFDGAGERLEMRLGDEGAGRGIHRHALGQMAARAGVPGAYLAELDAAGGWQRALAAEILTRHYSLGGSGKNLVRSVNGKVMGFLSDRYKRLDSRPILDVFADECRKVGALPIEGVVTDLRWSMKAILPMIFEPVPNEVLCLGVEIGHSDFGSGKLAVRAFIWRCLCANGATMEDALAQVHLGSTLGEDIEFSRRTYELDTKLSVSKVRDTTQNLLGPKKVNSLVEAIKASAEKSVDWRRLKTALAKKLLKEELKQVETAWDSHDVTMLPEHESVWRASNAVSWVAGHVEDPARKLELQRIAGEVIHGKTETSIAEAA